MSKRIKTIPIEEIERRRIAQIPTYVSEGTKYSIQSAKDELERTDKLSGYKYGKLIKENSNVTNASENAEYILELLSDYSATNGNKMFYEFADSILPYVNRQSLENIKKAVYFKGRGGVLESFTDTVSGYLLCDRVIENYAEISKRFDINGMIKCAEYKDHVSVMESVLELLDTYKRPLHSKIQVGLESLLYGFNKNCIECNSATVTKTVVDHFLAESDYISDTEYKNMKYIIENNSFLTGEDISGIYYVFNDHEFTTDKIFNIVGEDRSYFANEILNIVADNKSPVMELYSLITNGVFGSINDNYIQEECIKYSAVEKVVQAILASTINFANYESDISKRLYSKYVKFEKEVCNEPARARLHEVFDEFKRLPTYKAFSESLDIPKKPFTEKDAADIVDALYSKKILGNTKDLDDDEVVLYDSVDSKALLGKISESEDFAESEDVKDIINKYKAEQNKGFGKIKAAISHIYTKKPEQIIDDTPHILEFIRNFAILGSIAINPVIPLVLFCTDKYIAMSLKRKESEKILNYFKNEKEISEKKLDRLENTEKREKLSKYITELDKSIEKLSSYRDDLYTDKELENMEKIDEASFNDNNSLSLEEFRVSGYHNDVCVNITVAVQMIRNEIIRMELSDCGIKENLIDDLSIGKAFKYLTDDDIVNRYCNVDGLIDVALFVFPYIEDCRNQINYRTAATICETVNDHLSKYCFVSPTEVNGTAFIIFNFLRPIIADYSNSSTESFRTECAQILMLNEALDKFDAITNNDVFKILDKIEFEDIYNFSYVIENSMFGKDAYLEAVKDYIAGCGDSVKRAILNNVLDRDFTESAPLTIFEKSYFSLDCNNYVKNLVNEGVDSLVAKAKATFSGKGTVDTKAASTTIDGKKETVDSKEPKDDKEKGQSTLSKVVDKTADVVDTSIIFVRKLTSNIGLVSEVLKKKAQNLSTKEKEVSKNIDVSLSQVKKGLENAIVSDRREAVIKGSIIPSFSKLMKQAIVIGGIACFNPVLAAITAVGGLAISRSLTKKETRLLMDEIDIELVVLEKEINIAENDGDMARYRNLLMYQRKLQREKQRIKYRVKVKTPDGVPDIAQSNRD